MRNSMWMCLGLCLVNVVPALAFQAERIYFGVQTGTQTVVKGAELDGTDVTVVAKRLGDPEGMTLDVSEGKVFWTSDGIHKVNFDGTGYDLVLPETAFPLGLPGSIARSASQGKLYWVEGGGRIRRADEDGSNIETLVSNQDAPTGIAIDDTAGKMYWALFWARTIQRANLDGSDVEEVFYVGEQLRQIAVDPAGGKIYWTRFSGGPMGRANLDGTGIENAVNEGGYGLALDLSAGKMYWYDYAGFLIPAGIRRANLDGSNVEIIHPDIETRAMAVDAVAGKLYLGKAVLAEDAVVSRSELGGAGLEGVVTTLVKTPDALAADRISAKVYWTDPSRSTIVRANVDGTEVEDVTSAGFSPADSIVVDEQNRKLYWTGFESGVGVIRPRGLNLDLDQGKMYWAEGAPPPTFQAVIRRANLDGSEAEVVVLLPPGKEATSVALDLAEGRVYWSTSGDAPYPHQELLIQSADLDGSDIVDVVSMPSTTVPMIALQFPCCRLYGDVAPAGPPAGNCTVDVDDLLRVLAGFADPMNFRDTDIEPCGGDGDVDVDDLLAELGAFAGTYTCGHPCPS